MRLYLKPYSSQGQIYCVYEEITSNIVMFYFIIFSTLRLLLFVVVLGSPTTQSECSGPLPLAPQRPFSLPTVQD